MAKKQPTARLNFVECFTYELAREKREPVLWKGEGFGHTDLRAAAVSQAPKTGTGLPARSSR
jgi:uncharacterized protein with PIN domain